jgi:hypothetical protein
MIALALIPILYNPAPLSGRNTPDLGIQERLKVTPARRSFLSSLRDSMFWRHEPATKVEVAG